MHAPNASSTGEDNDWAISQVTSNVTLQGALYQVPPGIIVLLSCCYGAVSLAAVAGNGCVLAIVFSSPRMRTVTNYFIANLAVADLAIALFCVPFQFQAALLQRWLLPPFMCAFCPFVQVLSVNVSIVTLTAIACDRYRAVMSPLQARTSRTSAKLAILAIWACSGAAGLPYALALRVTSVQDPEAGNATKPFCHNVRVAPHLWKAYTQALVCVQYLAPLCLISLVYGSIGLRLRDAKTPGNVQSDRDAAILKNRKKIIKMLFIVVLLFALCWMPFQMYNILQEILPQINSYRYINVIWFCCHWLAMSNSCCNPFIYAIYNERFNGEFRKRFGCCLELFRRRGGGADERNAHDPSLSYG